MNLLIIILNFVAYFITFIYHYMHERLTIRTLFWLNFSLFSAFSIPLLASGLYFNVMEYSTIKPSDSLSVLPYVMMYCFVSILMSPFKYTKNVLLLSNIRFDYMNLQSKNIVRFSLFMMVIYLLLKIMQVSIVIRVGFGYFHDLEANIKDEILYSNNYILKYINYACKLVVVMLSPCIIFYLYYGFKRGIIKKINFYIYFIVYIVDVLVVGIVAGSRGTIYFGILTIVFFFIMTKIINSIRNKFGIVLFLLPLILIVLYVLSNITHERFDTTMAIEDNIIRYLGESFLNLGFEFYNHIKNHTDGRLFFSFLFEDYSMSDISNYTGLHIWWFETTYGTLFVDFDSFTPLLVATIIAIGMKYYIKKHFGKIEYIGLILYYYQFCCYIPFGYRMQLFDIVIILLLIVFPRIFNILFLKKKKNEIVAFVG